MKTYLSFSGGGPKGAFEAGVVMQLYLRGCTTRERKHFLQTNSLIIPEVDDWGVGLPLQHVDVVSGSSIGAFNAIIFGSHRYVATGTYRLAALWLHKDYKDAFRTGTCASVCRMICCCRDGMHSWDHKAQEIYDIGLATYSYREMLPATYIYTTNLTRSQPQVFHVNTLPVDTAEHYGKKLREVCCESGTVPFFFQTLPGREVYMDASITVNICVPFDAKAETADVTLILTTNPYTKTQRQWERGVLKEACAVVDILAKQVTRSNLRDIARKIKTYETFSLKIIWPSRDLETSLMNFDIKSRRHLFIQGMQAKICRCTTADEIDRMIPPDADKVYDGCWD